jgi:phosphoribosylanthranilate isomerase
MWVKICGLTCPEDAHAAIEAGADALGFNLWPGSKRYLPLAENAAWIAALPGRVERIAVLVNMPLPEAQRVAEHPAIDAVQFHGDESPAYLAEFAQLGRPYLVARRGEIGDAPGGRILLDAAVPGAYGGTGVTVDFAKAAAQVRAHPQRQIILAGGLTPENVATAVATVRPWGVDVASGVEASPRRKDAAKLRAFIQAARGLEI